jgi:uncharacterized membrane protein
VSNKDFRRRQLATASTQKPENAAIVQMSASFSGPIPPPGLLEKYNEVIPNGADRIMAMAERQSAHRESLEASVVAGNIANQARGTVFAFILCLVALSSGFYLVNEGRNIEGFASIVGSVGGILGTFIYSRIEQRKERVEKAGALTDRRHR